MQYLALFVVAVVTTYTVSAFLNSRRTRAKAAVAPDDLYYVFMVPALNEERVIGKTIERLLALPGKNFSIMVIDDGSDDRTGEIVKSYKNDRVWLLQRNEETGCRQGKGKALNYAYRYLRDSEVLGGRDPKSVIISIFDADGRVELNTLFEVGREFADPKIGGAQIGVRMYNRGEGLLAVMQDMEFVVFTEVFQRHRQFVGSVGLGGNGQFNRLAALMDLGDDPWTECLTEDLDLGIRLMMKGWRNRFVPTSHVSQQAVLDIKRLLKQRARWFQGHMQCWKLIPKVLMSPKLSFKESQDLTYHLMSPLTLLVMTFPSIIFMVSLIIAIITEPSMLWHGLMAHDGRVLILWYLFGFGMAPIYATVYWLNEKKVSWLKAWWYSHLYTLYGYMWFIAGWRAVWAFISRQKGWAKTARSVDAEEADTPELVTA